MGKPDNQEATMAPGTITEEVPLVRVHLKTGDDIDFRQTGTMETEIEKWMNLLKEPNTILLWKVDGLSVMFRVNDIAKVVIGDEELLDGGYDLVTPLKGHTGIQKIKHKITGRW
jgi:hypothetical protein